MVPNFDDDGGEFLDLENYGLDEVEGSGGNEFDLPDRGEYKLRVAECKLHNSGTGNRSIKFTVEVRENADGTKTDQAGKRFHEYRSLSEKEFPRRRLRQMLDALGLPVKGFSTREAVGREFVAMVDHQTSQQVNEQTGEYYVNARTKNEQSVAR